MSQPITAWLSIGSTYSYLTALRINVIQREMCLNLMVKLSASVHHEVDGQHSFPLSKKTKVDYMWRILNVGRLVWFAETKLPVISTASIRPSK